MIIAVEGISAAGKTTWASRFAPAVVDEICAIPPAADAETIGQFWAGKHVERWQRGLQFEQKFGTICIDTDPQKIHYEWCLWQIGLGSHDIWRATVNSARRATPKLLSNSHWRPYKPIVATSTSSTRLSRPLIAPAGDF
jgi:hypothetical protein